MEEGKKKEDKGFGEGIEFVKAEPEEEKDIEINFGKVLSFFKRKDEGKSAAAAKTPEEHKHAAHAEHNSSHTAEKEKKKEGEDAELDIGKLASGVKGLFKGKKPEAADKESPQERSDDEVSLNPKSIIEFFNKRGATLLLVVAILISLGLTANVRYQVSNLAFTEDWARNSVYNTIQSDIQNAINAQYPNLPDARKSQILAEEMGKARKGKTYTFKSAPYTGQSIELKNQVKGTAEFIKDNYRDGNGQAYSPDIDPYYWNRYAKNVLEKGRIGDEARNGLQWDTYQLAPHGRPIAAQDTFFPHFLAYLYKFARFFNHSATLWNVQTILYPMLINSLAVLMIFLIGRKVAGNVGGFFGSLMAGLHSAYVSRTIHGDNDAFVMFFAILTLWLFVEAIYARRKVMRLALPALAGLSAGLFSLAWGGWWFIFIFILAAAAAAIAAGIAKSAWQSVSGSRGAMGLKGMVKSALTGNVVRLFVLPTAVFFATTGVFVALFNGLDRFLATPLLAFGVTKLKTAVLEASYWPNVLTTVAELNPGNFNQVVSSIRPSIFWLSASSAAILAIVAALNLFFKAVNSKLGNKLKSVSPDENKALYYFFFATLIIVWFLGTIYASSKGIRFVVMLAPAVGLGFGVTLGLIFRFSLWINDNFLKINKIAAATVVFIVLATAVYSTDVIKNAYSIARNDVPIMNDAWYDSLTAIRDDSDNVTKSAIITSWWDFGHHFKSIADRRVTFDGTTQQGPQAHWVGRFFMTEDETEAAGILRMLDCGGSSAFDELDKVNKDFAGTIKMLYRLIATPSKEDAKEILTGDYRLTDAQAETVLKYTHCENPPEGYVIASEDMIGKSGVWGHFGSWDFEKGIIWQTLRGKSQKEAAESMMRMFSYSEEKAKAVYNDMRRIKNDAEANSWIAPWPSFSGELSGCQVLARTDNTTSTEEKIVMCGSGLVVNLTTNDAYFPLPDEKVLHPVSFVYLTNETGTEKIAKKTYANDTVPQRFSVILVPQGSNYYSAVSSPEQAAGMFTQMFFYEGRTLKHFRMLTHNRGMTGTNVYVYKAQWDTLK